MDPWNQIRSAYTVAKLGTVSAAADHLKVHRATVLRHIDSLESAMDTVLFVRHSKGYTPTQAGQELLSAASQADKAFRKLSLLGGERGELTGQLVISSFEVAHRIIAPAVARFRVRYPSVRVVTRMHDTPTSLDIGEADILIHGGMKPTEDDVVSLRLATLKYGLYASRAYVEAHGAPKTIKDLVRRPFIGPSGDHSHAPFFRWLERTIPPSNIVFRAASTEVARDALESDMGIGFFSCQRAEEHDNLVEVWPNLDEWNIDFWVVTHVDMHRTRKIQALLECLRDDGFLKKNTLVV